MTSPTWSISSGENFQPFEFASPQMMNNKPYKKKNKNKKRNRIASTSSQESSAELAETSDVDLLGLVRSQLKITNDSEASGTDASRANTPQKMKQHKYHKQNSLPRVAPRERYASSSFDFSLDAIPELPAHWKKGIERSSEYSKLNLIA